MHIYIRTCIFKYSVSLIYNDTQGESPDSTTFNYSRTVRYTAKYVEQKLYGVEGGVQCNNYFFLCPVIREIFERRNLILRVINVAELGDSSCAYIRMMFMYM